MKIEEWLADQILDAKVRVVAITGAADLGKSYLAESLVGELQKKGTSAVCLGLDSYLLPRDERVARGLSGYDPKAHDLNAARDDIERLVAGETVEYFAYRHDVGRRAERGDDLQPADYIVIEGLHAMHPSLARFVDFSIFIFTSDETLRFIRREADMKKRKLTMSEATMREASELGAYDKYVNPYKASCNVSLCLVQQWRYHVA